MRRKIFVSSEVLNINIFDFLSNYGHKIEMI